MKLVYIVCFGLMLLSGCSGSTKNKTKYTSPFQETDTVVNSENGIKSSDTMNVSALQEKSELVKAVKNGLISYSTNGTENELIASLENVKNALREKDQHFQIDCSKDTTIVGVNGTSIHIKAGSFVLPNGNKVDGKIDFTLLECYDLLSFFSNNLSTQTVSNKILETAGSVKIEATQNGLRLSLDTNKTLDIAFPIPEYQRNGPVNMSTFYAETEKQSFVRWNDNASALTNQLSSLRSNGKDTIITESYIYMDTTESQSISWKLKDSNESLKDWMKSEQLRTDILKAFAANRKVATLKMTLRPDGKVKEITGTRIVEQDLKDALYTWLKKAPKLDMTDLQTNHPYTFKIRGTQINRNVGMENYIKKELDENGTLNKDVSSKMVGKYLLSVTQLGWVNCDSYMSINTFAYTLTVPREENTEYLLVSEQNYAVFRPSTSSNLSLSFEMIPGGRNYRLYAIKNSENGLFYNEKVIKVNKNITEALLASIAIKLADLKNRLWFRD